MKFGVGTNLTYYNMPIAEMAKTIETMGFESLWLGEHPIIPVERKGSFIFGGELPETYKHMPDPFIWLTAAATATTRLRLGFDVCLVPERNPLITAKEVACLDYISGGRVIFGIGAGWMQEETEIMGVQFKSRWARTEECVRAMKELWTEEKAQFQGEFIRFPSVYSYPKPVQKPHPPILIGAGSPDRDSKYALRRVVAIGDGWMPVFMSPERMRTDLATLKTLCEQAGRDFSKLDITVVMLASALSVGESMSSLGNLRVDDVQDRFSLIRQYEDIGVQRIIIGFAELTAEAGARVLTDAASLLKL